MMFEYNKFIMYRKHIIYSLCKNVTIYVGNYNGSYFDTIKFDLIKCNFKNQNMSTKK